MSTEPITLNDEEVEYLLKNYSHLLGPQDMAAFKVIHAELKAAAAEGSHPHLAARIRKRWGAEDEQVQQLLPGGVDAFRRDAALRIARGHSDEVLWNRCAKCSHLPRTPRARQCLHCGHQWR